MEPKERRSVEHLDILLARWRQSLTRHGQRNKAQAWVRQALQQFQRQLQLKSPQSAREALLETFQILQPSLEVRRVRVGGTTHLVPAAVPPSRQVSLMFRWIREGARQRKKNTKLSFPQCLAQELVDAHQHRGHALQKKQSLHRQAEANRAFSHYRWW